MLTQAYGRNQILKNFKIIEKRQSFKQQIFKKKPSYDFFLYINFYFTESLYDSVIDKMDNTGDLYFA